ncbi:MAG: hypothetical protein ACPG49_00205 [Chitinophagales bacterium]
MTAKTLMDCERKKLKDLTKYQLPNHFKAIGVGLTIISFAALFLNKFAFNLPEFRLMAKYGMLIGLLLVSISKEKIEDERIGQLRMQSYAFAFIAGVLHALVLPFMDFLVDAAFQTKEAILKDAGDFMILWILLSIQVLYFEFLKKLHG